MIIILFLFIFYFSFPSLGRNGQTMGQGTWSPEHLLSGYHPSSPLHHVSTVSNVFHSMMNYELQSYVLCTV